MTFNILRLLRLPLDCPVLSNLKNCCQKSRFFTGRKRTQNRYNPNARISRKSILIKNLDLSKPGIEIAPLYRPTVLKHEAEVYYVDVCSSEESVEKHKHYEHAEIVEIDHVWLPDKKLKNCVSNNLKFDWVIASHVLEHIPDPVGWLNQILECMNIGGRISLALPRKEWCFDKFRHDTTVSELLDAYFLEYQVPSTRQIYDFLSNGIANGFLGSGIILNRKELCEKSYTIHQALEFVTYVRETKNYLDVHCSVFSPDTILDLFSELTQLGIINVEVVCSEERGDDNLDFFVELIKTGEPAIKK